MKGWGDTNGLPAVLLLNRHNEHSLTKYWSGRLGLMLAYYSVKCLGSIIMLSSDKNDWSFKKLESSKSFFLDCANLTNFIFLNTPISFRKIFFYTDNVNIISLFFIFIFAIYSDVPKLMQLFPDVIVTHQTFSSFQNVINQTWKELPLNF